MRRSGLVGLTAVLAMALPGLSACSVGDRAETAAGDPEAPPAHERGPDVGEHGEGGGHHADGEPPEGPGGGEGEESREHIALDATRRGLRLRPSLDSAAGAFVGAVENATKERLCAVRVEVHLAESVELGPTERTDLHPGESGAGESGAGVAGAESAATSQGGLASAAREQTLPAFDRR